MQRFGQIIRLRPEQYDTYKRLHAAVPEPILAALREANITNYSIFHRGGLLFAYFEYVGSDLDADMAKVAADPETHAWWALTDPCQQPFEGSSSGSREGNWWLPMESLFHMD
jgi:L-rhamnose mutarotase